MFDEMFSINQLMSAGFGGVVAGLVSWGANSVHLKWLRRDVNTLLYTVHSPKNPNNLVSQAQEHKLRIQTLETVNRVNRR